jgi:hypothetical protein
MNNFGHLRHLPKSMLERMPGMPEYDKKRKDNLEKSEILLINQQTQRIIQQLNDKLKGDIRFEEIIKKSKINLRGKSTLYLRGRQDYEDIDIAIESIKFILNSLLLMDDKNLNDLYYQLQNPKQLLRRLIPNNLEINNLDKMVQDRL